MKKCIALLFLNFTISMHASFTLSGSTITQTSTDNDLSGLTLISGVTQMQIASGTDTEFTVYDLGNYNLVIDGTLTIDASKEMLIIGPSAPTSIVLVNGTLNINDYKTLNGFTAYNQRTAIRSTYINNSCCNNFSLLVEDSGTFNMQGGGLEFSSSIKFKTDSTVNIQDGRIELLSAPHPQYQIRQFSNNLTANGLKMINYAMTMVGLPIQFDDYEPTQADEGINFSSSSSNSVYSFRNYSGGGRGNRLDIGLWAGKKGKMINSASGTNLEVQEHLVGNANSTGTWEITKEIAPTILDVSGNPIQSARMYIRDLDNGNRIDGNGYDFSNDRTYFETTNTNGEISTTEILTGAINHLSTGTVLFDRRSKNNDTNDEFDILFYHYNKVLSKSTQKLKGIDELTFEWTMFEDTNITEDDQTIVANYTSIDDLGQLYDYAKYWKQINETNIEIPSVDDLLIENESSILNLGNYNLIVDGTASTVFNVDTSTSTITIKSNTITTTSKFIGIKTTGTITIVNGASLEHGYIDNSGTYKFVNLKWNQSTTNDVVIVNNDDLTYIEGPSIETTTYKSHLLVPDPVPTNGIDVQINILSNGPNLFQEMIPTTDLNFVRLDIDLIDIGTELNQLKILNISKRLLAKIEAINYAMLDSTAPNLIINETITNVFEDGTLANQEAIIAILKRLLSKVSAAREALKND